MTQPPNETPDLPEEAIGGVPVEAPTAGDGGADGAAGDGGADGAAGDGAAGDGGADGGA